MNRLPSAIATAVLLSLAPAEANDLPGLRLLVETSGAYRVVHDDRLLAAWPEPCRASADLALTSRAGAHRIWVEDGGDGRFDRGDWIEFVGEALPHDDPELADMTRFNVYTLRCDRAKARRIASAAVAAPDAVGLQPVRTSHLEQDRIMLRFSDADPTAERWYWARLTPLTGANLDVQLDLEGLDRDSELPVQLRVRIRGWSQPVDVPAPEIADHRVEAYLDHALIGSVEWHGQDVAFLDATVPAAGIATDLPTLRLVVPDRPSVVEGDPISDVVAVDWIDVAFPHSGRIAGAQVRLEIAGRDAGPGVVSLAGTGSILAFGCDGTRLEARPVGRRRPDGTVPMQIGLSADATSCGRLDVCPSAAFLRPAALEPEVVADLARPRRADMIVIAHPRLIDAVAPLAALHRRHGLEVEVVDLRAVYDEFGDGLAHPRAIRAFLHHAWRRWTPPAPRFVLLVGDASWDAKNDRVDESAYAAWTWQPRHGTRLPATQGTAYADSGLHNNRNLVPTWSVATPQGHAASDAPFVTFDGDDRPVMAIARFPVTEPDEVTAIVAKTAAALDADRGGDWRRSLLWISDGESYMDAASDRLASRYEQQGFLSTRIKPEPDDHDADSHRQRLIHTLGAGHLLVHFIGHGGRFIWRTAPADYSAQRDLFRLEDVEALPPSAHLPVVVSMTCYSAPFDHPHSDSIGEKLLRTPERGAAAVIAASWRVSADAEASRLMIDRLTIPGTVGEALLAAKRATPSRQLIELFNLLGDPALPLAAPAGRATLELTAGDPPTLRVELPSELGGSTVQVEWLDPAGEVIASDRLTTASARIEVVFTGAGDLAARVFGARLVASDPRSGLQAIGATTVRPR